MVGITQDRVTNLFFLGGIVIATLRNDAYFSFFFGQVFTNSPRNTSDGR